MSKATGFFLSCKINQPGTIKRHRSFDVAAKRVGDYGLVYSDIDKTVKQVFSMSNGAITGFDVHKRPDKCSVGDFDFIKVLAELGMIELT
jgi:hypothetical protein